MPEGDPSNQYTRSVDIFAYGLLMLELLGGRRVDKNGDTGYLELQERLDGVQDPQAQAFLARCMAAPEQRPSARELLEDSFLQVGVLVVVCVLGGQAGAGWLARLPCLGGRLGGARVVRMGFMFQGQPPACFASAAMCRPASGPTPLTRLQPPKKAAAPTTSADQELVKSKSDAVQRQNSGVRGGPGGLPASQPAPTCTRGGCPQLVDTPGSLCRPPAATGRVVASRRARPLAARQRRRAGGVRGRDRCAWLRAAHAWASGSLPGRRRCASALPRCMLPA